MGARALVRRSALRAGRSAPFAAFVELLERAARPREGVLPVLAYHRVDDSERSPGLFPGLVSATPAQFVEQVGFLTSRFRLLSVEELLAVRRGQDRVPPRSVLVTFDDGYRDFAEHAWPILRRHGVPVVLFVPTAYPDRPERSFWWDRLYSALIATARRNELRTPIGPLALASEADRILAFRQLRAYVKSLPHQEAMALVEELSAALGAGDGRSAVLGWRELRSLADEGVTLAPHSRTHPLLHRLPPESARAEIAGSVEDLEREIGPTPPVFAYPGGGETDEVARLLAAEGLEVAFGTRRGSNDLRSANWLRLRRINVGRASTLALVRAQLLPWWARR
jgi:peptidoglycan/xylan/chitin deacetylase (PgdA/CDA1 family)